MTTRELRHKVINRINDFEDDSLLNDIVRLLDNNVEEKEVYRLSNNHQKAINKAVKQIEKGDYLTNEQSNKEIDEWLRK